MKNSKIHPPAGGPKSNTMQGYTLIELVVVIGLTAILLMTAVSLFFTTFQGGGKTASAEYVKQAGNSVVETMSFSLRNSLKLIPASGQSSPCLANMSAVAVQNQDMSTTEYSLASSKLRVIKPTGTQNLTPDDLTVTSFSITCTPVSYGQPSWNGAPPRVTINFTLQKGTNGVTAARDIVTIPFSTSVTLRNY